MKLYKICNKISLLLHVLASAAGYFVMEAICRHSFIEAWNYMTQRPLVFAYNAAFIFTSSLIVYLFHRRVFWRILVTLFWLILAIINGVLLLNRVTPFTGPDLHLITDAMKIANKYLPVAGVVAVCILFGILVILLLMLLIKGPKYQKKIKYRYNIPLILLAVALFAGSTQLALEKRVLSNYFGNIAFAYEDYGYPYCLATTIFNTGISCPRDYSEKEIKRIEKTEKNLPETQEEKRPNILFLQLESFFDPTLVNYLDISEDPIPTFRKLMKEYSSGYYKVPSVGAGTANTEFEVLTGMSLDYFGPGEYPYKTILQQSTCESIAYNLKELGFGTHVIHNNTGTFYDRHLVFPNLGFDSFTSLEYMNHVDKNPLGWAKDTILTTEIIKSLLSTDQRDFVYAISVQPHGKYPSSPLGDEHPITVSSDVISEQDLVPFSYYVNQLYEEDAFLRSLIESLETYGEPTVLILYGDHLPSISAAEEYMAQGDLLQTEYVIWDNIGLEKQDRDLEAYQLSASILKKLGIRNGFLNSYHQSFEENPRYQEYLEMLEYDMLYGKQAVYGGTSGYEPTDMQMGVVPITLSQCYLLGDTFYVLGDCFTPYSRICINGDPVNTEFISVNAIKGTDLSLKDGDQITVSQIGEDGIPLSETESIAFTHSAPGRKTELAS